MGVPDLRFINRKVPIHDVAGALDLRLGANGNFHCWRPESHQNGDRTASVGVRKTNNTVKCFGCGIGPLGPVDLVMAVHGLTNPGDAAHWIAERFEVPDLPAGKHLITPVRGIFQVGFEGPIELLVRSSIWTRLSAPARSIIPVLLELAVRNSGKCTELCRSMWRLDKAAFLALSDIFPVELFSRNSEHEDALAAEAEKRNRSRSQTQIPGVFRR
jgi:hypothetical protein